MNWKKLTAPNPVVPKTWWIVFSYLIIYIVLSIFKSLWGSIWINVALVWLLLGHGI